MDGMITNLGQEMPQDARDFLEQLHEGETVAPVQRGKILERINAIRGESAALHARSVNRLERLGIPDHVIVAGIVRCRRTGASLVHELASANQLDLHAYFCLLADDLGLPFETSINPKRILIDVSATNFRPGRTIQVCGRDNGGGLVLYMAPDLRAENQLASLFDKDPSMRSRFCICDPNTILTVVETKLAQKGVDAAVKRLHERLPHLSAKETLIPWQAFVLGAFVVLFPICLWNAFWPTLFLVHAIAIVLFGVSVAIRFNAWLALRVENHLPSQTKTDGNFPVYSVMVALHKEAEVVPQLVRAISRLDWPTSRLEVLYVCEADDAETIAALNGLRLPAPHRIICVPAALPRTKPKALNYALERCTGDFIVIYDAEDRPHPQQLKEAWQRFCSGPENLACLQAPLNISNAGESWLSRLFAFEYAAHFHGLLPYLSKIGAPLPLGGTSNHFRRSALTEVMGWDPFNVTEDADLGIRFYRFGYFCGVLALPTQEDAPCRIHQWIPQRTRWIKGWMQTFLVHNRDYRDLNIRIGAANNIIFQILMIGFIFSPLLYGISIFEILYFLNSNSNKELYSKIIIFLDLAIFAIGHVGYALLALASWKRVQGRSSVGLVMALPAYWLLASFAAWRAVWKLVTVPHQWEKTPHQIAYKGPRNTSETDRL